MNWGLITCERETIHGKAMLTKIAKFSYAGFMDIACCS